MTESYKTRTKKTAMQFKKGAKKHGYYVRVTKLAKGYKVTRRSTPFGK